MIACKECKYFEAYQADPRRGKCRRFPPVRGESSWLHVPVSIDDWCGEFYFDPSKRLNK